jgi:uncharacterized protein
MRPYMNSAVWSVVLSLLLTAACEAGSSAPPPSTPVPTPAKTIPLPRGPILGIGEPRIPQPYTLDQRLLDAASRGDRKTIELALQRGAHLEAKDDIGRSAAFRAVLDAGDLDLLRWLHGKGAAIDEADSGGRTPLSFAAANGRLDLVRYLVENGAAVNHTDMQKRTALFQAAIGGHLEIARLLLDHGADPNLADQFRDTPLMVACAKGFGEVAELLLARGADPALKDEEGRTASQRAAPGTAACMHPAPKTP